MSDPDIAARKTTARRAARAARAAAASPDRAAAANARLVETVLAGGLPRVVSAYRAIGAELDPMPTYEALLGMGAQGCLPVVRGKGRPLAFRLWAPGDALEVGVFDVEIPRDGAEATPDLLIVPLLAFDRRGFRLGYGGGFYDRTLAALRAAGPVRAIGFAYAGQEVAEVPTEPTDAPLDLIVTEDGSFAPRRRP